MLLRQKREKIMRAQGNYRDLVHQLYTNTQPFGFARPKTLECFEVELKILAEMIGHCIILDSSEILYMYAIRPIQMNPNILASSHNINAYINVFSEKFSISHSMSEKIYLAQLINELKLISNGDSEVA